MINCGFDNGDCLVGIVRTDTTVWGVKAAHGDYPDAPFGELLGPNVFFRERVAHERRLAKPCYASLPVLGNLDDYGVDFIGIKSNDLYEAYEMGGFVLVAGKDKTWGFAALHGSIFICVGGTMEDHINAIVLGKIGE